MNNLDKMEVFRQCGFGDASINYGTSHMPHIQFNGYDKVMEYCYDAGYAAGQASIANTKYVRSFDEVVSELAKNVKDLEIENNMLTRHNQEFQADNEELTEEVKQYAKRCDELRKANIELNFHQDEALRFNNELASEVLSTSPKSKFVITVEEF